MSASPLPYPHEPACLCCRQRGVCFTCGLPKSGHGCTNGRCAGCHSKICGSGGANSPGHGFFKRARLHDRAKR